MCDPVTAAVVTAAVASVASAAVGAYGSYQQGKATQAQYNYQAQVNRNNAKVAEANAAQARQEGIEESRMQRMKTLQKVGAQQAAMAANGIDISTGTALDTIEDTAAMGELDALTTRYNAETKGLAYDHQANNFNNQANLDVFAGKNAYRAGVTNAITTGLDGVAQAGSVATNWYSPNSIGKSTTKVSGGVRGDNITFA